MIGIESEVPRRRWSRAVAQGLALVALVGLAMPAQGEPGKLGKPGYRGNLVERHAVRLGLDDQTLAAVKQIVHSSAERDRELFSQIAAARGELHRLLAQDAPRASEVFEQARRIGELEIGARINRLEATMAVRAKLRPDQLEELVRIRDEERTAKRSKGIGPCVGDVSRHCSEIETGPEVMTCLAEHWEKLSPVCQIGFNPQPRVSEAPAR